MAGNNGNSTQTAHTHKIKEISKPCVAYNRISQVIRILLVVRRDGNFLGKWLIHFPIYLRLPLPAYTHLSFIWTRKVVPAYFSSITPFRRWTISTKTKTSISWEKISFLLPLSLPLNFSFEFLDVSVPTNFIFNLVSMGIHSQYRAHFNVWDKWKVQKPEEKRI